MVQKNIPYLDYLKLKDQLKGYASPKSKLTSMIKSEKIFKIKRGLYLENENQFYSSKTLANIIYGPSYISFEYALAFYNLIPERVNVFTCASYAKNKSKLFKTRVGIFSYRSIPALVYPFGLIWLEENDSPFLIASKEKAVCDTLSKIEGINTIESVKNLLYQDLRIEENSLLELNIQDLEELIPLYNRKILRIFLKLVKKVQNNA